MPYGCRRNVELRYGFRAAIGAIMLAAGCASITGSPGTGGGGEAGRRTHEAGGTASGPATGLGDPAAVAAAYVIASGSGGAPNEAEHRVRAMVTERFARTMRRAPAAGGTVRVEQVFVPDGAPSPTADQRYLTVTGFRGDRPLQVSLRLVRVGGRWLVDEVFLF
ncbi:hypothetical protein ACQP1K_29420 (plasmid) [Sphaerimonospora sp. CA-214678]|uniref:hypothetical protein n=1 Tax=Sphaerimonospora sp. CA-214678 TaxID=3240029 RepID=UPI003D91F5A3